MFNIGSRDKTTVSELATLVCKELLINPKFEYTGTPRGWVGDVKLMLLDTKKLEALGWEQKVSFEAGLAYYLAWLERLHR